jgi:hypothetical protein
MKSSELRAHLLALELVEGDNDVRYPSSGFAFKTRLPEIANLRIGGRDFWTKADGESRKGEKVVRI